MGNVILFDPIRSESISARTIFDPLCSIAPAADCKTFALGYVPTGTDAYFYNSNRA